MKIDKVKRPWYDRQHRRGQDPFYKTTAWKELRKTFLNSTSVLPDGKVISNSICKVCYLEGKLTPAYAVDHIHRIKSGGDAYDINNLQSLCKHHHAVKSGEEGLESLQNKPFKAKF